MAVSLWCSKPLLVKVSKCTPSLMPFTLTDNPQFYGLKVSLSNIFMRALFCSNMMEIFSKTEKKGTYTDDVHMEGEWRGVLRFATCLQILFLNKPKMYCSFLWMKGVTELIIFCGFHKYMNPKWFKITTNSIIRGSSFLFIIKPDTFWLHYIEHPITSPNHPSHYFSLHWCPNQSTCYFQ